ncbi:hypothetical protein [Musicola keenii]|uniref:hypothetical protein n=1 Tax=Musicola keenii TaxID=2884250 RepID=UPI00178086BA|nr:hypothetical protein [Musicola keenii]
MKTLTKICGTATFITCLSLIAAVPGASASPERADAPAFGQAGAFPPPPAFMPPMPALYHASLQTTDPVQAVGKLSANVPAGNGKLYEVSISIRELPPQPEQPKNNAGK